MQRDLMERAREYENYYLHLPSLGDMPALRRHAYIMLEIDLRWRVNDDMIFLSKFIQRKKKIG